MVLEATKRESEFSYERFESLMSITNTTWEQLNKELECDVKSILKHKPMPNIVGKACRAMGLKNGDYVMMKTNTFDIKEPVVVNDEFINVSDIYLEMLELYFKESEWSWKSISTLMSYRTILMYGLGYLKDVTRLRKDDLYNLCYALSCKPADICMNGENKCSKRVLNPRQKYILSKDVISSLSKHRHIEKVCKYANVPTWFIHGEQHVSIEMVDLLCNAITKITGKSITREELCLNYKETEKETVTMNIPKEVEKAIGKVEETHQSKEIEPKDDPRINGIEPPSTTQPSKPPYHKRRYNKPNTNICYSSYMEEVFNRIDGMTDENFDRLLEYVEASKKLRELRKDLLK